MEMAKYILQILRAQPIVVFSWGFHHPTALPNDRGLAFIVDGFLYKGRVEVVYNDALDLFEIRLGDGRVEEMVYCDNLVAVIDTMVERCENYKVRVKQEYGTES